MAGYDLRGLDRRSFVRCVVLIGAVVGAVMI